LLIEPGNFVAKRDHAGLDPKSPSDRPSSPAGMLEHLLGRTAATSARVDRLGAVGSDREALDLAS
jgi:hypothetical protein